MVGVDYEKKIINEFKALGQTPFEIVLSPQAKAIISRMGEKFPLEHFKKWWISNFAVVGGQHLHMYFSVENGFQDSVR